MGIKKAWSVDIGQNIIKAWFYKARPVFDSGYRLGSSLCLQVFNQVQQTCANIYQEITAFNLASWWHVYSQVTLAGLCATACALIGWQILNKTGSLEYQRLSTPTRSYSFKIDINAADWPELTLLPRIGPTLSRRIVQARQEHGPFKGPEDLLAVRGIGPKILCRVQPFLLFPEGSPTSRGTPGQFSNGKPASSP